MKEKEVATIQPQEEVNTELKDKSEGPESVADTGFFEKASDGKGSEPETESGVKSSEPETEFGVKSSEPETESGVKSSEPASESEVKDSELVSESEVKGSEQESESVSDKDKTGSEASEAGSLLGIEPWGEEDEAAARAEQEAYEQRRAIRMERLTLRKKKRRRQKMIIVGALLLGALGAAALGAYRMGLFEQVMIQTADQTAVNDHKPDTASAGAAKQEPSEGESGNQEDQEADPASSQSVEEEKEPVYTPDAEDIFTLEQARLLAAQYDYDKAIKLLKKYKNYKKNKDMQAAVKEFKEIKATCTAWPLEEVTHVFYHTLIKDTSKAFDGDYKSGDYNQVMTTIDEFNKITQAMYDRGYVMVSIYDMASVNEDGTMTRGELLLPPGKIPFVLSQDDVSYYHYMDGDGYATKLIVDEEGKVRNEYVEDDGSISVGDYDMVPLIDRFVEEHPDFSYRGAKGIVALTGYNGILGYRTDSSYETRPADLDADKVKWLDDHPEFNLEEERAGARKVADAMRAEGWLFASHTWGHKNVADASMERLRTDTQLFKENVDPLIGGTDIIIFAFGTDMAAQGEYSGEKFEYFKSQGYHYYCNVDSSKYFVQIRDRYFRQGRRNLDGYRMYYNPELLEDLFDAGSVLDAARPLPVPQMG